MGNKQSPISAKAVRRVTAARQLVDSCCTCLDSHSISAATNKSTRAVTANVPPANTKIKPNSSRGGPPEAKRGKSGSDGITSNPANAKKKVAQVRLVAATVEVRLAKTLRNGCRKVFMARSECKCSPTVPQQCNRPRQFSWLADVPAAFFVNVNPRTSQ